MLVVETRANCSLDVEDWWIEEGCWKRDNHQCVGWLRDASCWEEHEDAPDNDSKIGSLLYNPGRRSDQAHRDSVWSLIDAWMDCGRSRPEICQPQPQ